MRELASRGQRESYTSFVSSVTFNPELPEAEASARVIVQRFSCFLEEKMPAGKQKQSPTWPVHVYNV